MKNDVKSLDAFTLAYIQCALWASTAACGTPLDEVFTAWDIDANAFARMVEDCRRFQTEQEAKLTTWYLIGQDPDHAGHDFWLTRNRHGAGFWSRYAGLDESKKALGRELTDAATAYGSSELYIADDESVCLSGVAPFVSD